MSFDYSSALARVSDARSKRSRAKITKKFIDTLRCENRDMPMFDADKLMNQPHSAVKDDCYSNELLRRHAPNFDVQGLVAKYATGDGNCLFNATSTSLIGNELRCIFFI